MNVAIIGCGLIGEKRARALGKHCLVITADTNIKRAEYVASINNSKAIATTIWEVAASHSDVDIVIVATTNNWLSPIGLFALERGKHVLLEKPAARSSHELEPLYNKARLSQKKVKVGFNLRYHPAMLKAKEIIDSGAAGELMFIRGRYGHGGRVGYEKEWRAKPEISGGGELIDQGVHLIDLSRWYMGNLELSYGKVQTCFWDMPVDDNAFIALQTEDKKTAWLHVSCSEWKNTFCLEIYGKNAKLQIDGLGGSYGIERLTFYKMLPEMGPPETTMGEYPGEDRSWNREFNAFVQSIEQDTPMCGDLTDAYEALKIGDTIYQGNV